VPATSQLRVYTIAEGKLDDFVKGWSDGVAPLRRAHGYRIDGAWTVPDENKFVWIMTYEGEEDWDAKDRAYYASPDRASLDPDPATLIIHAEKSFLTPLL
jgi:NIPSNAP